MQPIYRVVARVIDGQEIELAGVQAHIQELNGLTLFRCPPDTSDEMMAGLQELLAEAFRDMDPTKIIVARGGFDLRLEAIEARPADLYEQRQWLKDTIAKYQEELNKVEAQIRPPGPQRGALAAAGVRLHDADGDPQPFMWKENGRHYGVDSRGDILEFDVNGKLKAIHHPEDVIHGSHVSPVRPLEQEVADKILKGIAEDLDRKLTGMAKDAEEPKKEIDAHDWWYGKD